MVGSSMREGATVSTHNNTKGLVRAFDVRTGKQIWRFNTIPGPGEYGNETWENDSWAVNGNVGVWTQISVDEELGLAYLPIDATPIGTDFEIDIRGRRTAARAEPVLAAAGVRGCRTAGARAAAPRTAQLQHRDAQHGRAERRHRRPLAQPRRGAG